MDGGFYDVEERVRRSGRRELYRSALLAGIYDVVVEASVSVLNNQYLRVFPMSRVLSS